MPLKDVFKECKGKRQFSIKKDAYRRFSSVSNEMQIGIKKIAALYVLPGAAMFDSAMSFALIRGGHIDACVLGGLQVDEEANLANWVVPGKMVPGMGGAMDLVTGSRKVIIAMEHCAKDGSAKILRSCTMPLTAQHAVHMLVTELAVFRFIDGKMWLTEIADGCDLATVRAKTEARFEVAADLNTQRGDL